MSVAPPSFMPPLVGALGLAIGVSLTIQRLKIPYTVALAGAGIIVGSIGALVFDTLDTSGAGALSADLILFLILPPLLFEGATKMDARELKRNWRTVSMLAVPSVILNTVIIGGIIWLLVWQGDGSRLMYALLLGAILAPTDPVSVLATFKEAGAPHRLATIVEGEALFNDGTGVVVFSVLLSLVIEAGQSAGITTTVLTGIGQFLLTVLVGAAVGAGLGMVANSALDWTDDHLVEVTISVATAFGAFLVAEQLHGSGVIAVVIAGLMVGSYGKIEKMTPQARVALDGFWEQVAFVINSVLFILLGFEVIQRVEAVGQRAVMLAFASIIAASIARLVIYPKMRLTPYTGEEAIPNSWHHIVYLSGLRGSVSLALLLLVAHISQHPEPGTTAFPPDIYADIFVMVASVVLFTLLVQGPMISWLIKKLGIIHGSDGRSEEFEEALATIVADEAALRELSRLEAAGLASKGAMARLKPEAQGRLLLAQDKLRELIEDPVFASRLSARTEARVLAAAQSALEDAEIVGLISGHTGSDMRWLINTDLALILRSEDAGGEVPLPKAKVAKSDPLTTLTESD